MLTSYEFVSAWLQARCKTDRGASLVEYALLVALIAVVCIAAVTLLGRNASSKLSRSAAPSSNRLRLDEFSGVGLGPPLWLSPTDKRKATPCPSWMCPSERHIDD